RKSRSARNAVWPSRTTKTSVPATSSNVSAWKRCSVRSKRGAQARSEKGVAQAAPFLFFRPHLTTQCYMGDHRRKALFRRRFGINGDAEGRIRMGGHTLGRTAAFKGCEA